MPGGTGKQKKCRCLLIHTTQKSFFSVLKAVYGPSKPGSTPLQSADGSMLIKDQEGLRNRWAEHFSTLLNKPSTVDPTALEQVPQQPTLNDLDLTPSMDELSKALKQKTLAGRRARMPSQQKSTKPQVQEPWKFSLILSKASGIKRRCQTTSVMH